MKKLYLLMIGALAASMTACSDEEPTLLKTDGEAIDFRPGFSGSRATETTNANLNSITVTAIDSAGAANYFTDLTFTKGGDGFFTSSPVYYWPGDDRNLTFYAYSPTMEELGADITIDNTTKEMTGFAVADSIKDQVDFVTAVATGKKSANEVSGVQLNFNHQLAQIELMAKTDNTAYKYVVKGMRIGRDQYMGTFDFATSTWTLDEWHDTHVLTSYCDSVVLSSDPVSIMGDAGNAMLIPQTLVAWPPIDDTDNVTRGAYFSVLVRITTADGDVVYPFSGDKRSYGWVSIPFSGTWEAGKKYVYTLDFTNGAGYVDPDEPIKPGYPVLQGEIKFNVNVSDWDNSSQDISMEATQHRK